MSSTVKIKTQEKASSYEIRIGGGLLASSGEWARTAVTNEPGRAAIISNKKVFGLYGEALSNSLRSAGFSPAVHLIGDGERF